MGVSQEEEEEKGSPGSGNSFEQRCRGPEWKGWGEGLALVEGPQPKALHRPGCCSKLGRDPRRAVDEGNRTMEAVAQPVPLVRRNAGAEVEQLAEERHGHRRGNSTRELFSYPALLTSPQSQLP